MFYHLLLGGIILQKQEAAQEGKCCCCLDKTFSKTGDSTKALDAATWIALQICESFRMSEDAPIRFFIHQLADVCQRMPITGQWPVWTSLTSHINKTELLQGSSVTKRYLIIQNSRFTCFHWRTYLHLPALSSIPLLLWTVSALCPGEACECFLKLLNFNSKLPLPTPNYVMMSNFLWNLIEINWFQARHRAST